MAPDLNSLPPSRSPTASTSSLTSPFSPPSGPAAQLTHPMATPSESSLPRRETPSPSPRSASTSLQAAAALNAGLQHEESRHSSISSTSRSRHSPHTGRRRSTVLMNLQLNDPTVPSPGEMIGDSAHRTTSPQPLTASPSLMAGDPHHRAPSLGEIHQELEQEQEAQVNRLLQMIRSQQQQLQALQAASGHTPTQAAVDDSTPTSERSMSFPSVPANPPTTTATSSSSHPTVPRSPSISSSHPRASFDLTRADIHGRRSRTPSRTASPRLRASSITGEASGEGVNLAGRDESAFYQAETQMLTRENQMLRMRIRELERQVADLHANANITHEPAIPSHLLRSQSVSEEEESQVAGAATSAGEVKE